MHELEQILSVLVQGRWKQGAGAIVLNPRFLEGYKQTLFHQTYLLIYRLLPTLLQIFRPSAVSVVQQVS